jgi:hypothetical protein
LREQPVLLPGIRYTTGTEAGCGWNDHGSGRIAGRYIARDDDSVGPLFDWFGNGDVE